MFNWILYKVDYIFNYLTPDTQISGHKVAKTFTSFITHDKHASFWASTVRGQSILHMNTFVRKRCCREAGAMAP